MQKLQAKLQPKDLDAFLVTSKESIYYLTGVTYEPLERPFFIFVPPEGEPELLTPALEKEHLRTSTQIAKIHTYWDYPSPKGQGWPERLEALVRDTGRLGVEPSLHHPNP